MEETLLSFGSPAVKALGEGKIAGPLVIFTTADDPDMTGDYFTKSTQFFVEDGAVMPVLYDHGLDATIKRKKIGRAKVEYKDAMLWAESQLDLSDAFQEEIYKLAEAGKLSYSSGAATHMVSKRKVKNAKEILEWGIAEISLTPIPAEPRCGVGTLKTYVDERVDYEGVKAAWSASYINDLPDSAFAFIEDGGEKDEDEKTTPRSLRHFPYKDSDGNLDEPHVRNALARIPQSNLDDEVKEKALKVIRAAAKKLSIEASEDMKKSIKGVFEDELREHTPTYWQYQSALECVVRKIALAAANVDVTGTSFDVSAKVEEAISEYALRIKPLILNQITEYAESENRPDHFYLKGNPFDSVIDEEGSPRAGLTFSSHLDSVLAAVKGVANRTKEIHSMRAEIKAGRKLSAARLEKLDQILELLRSLKEEAMPDMAEDQKKSVDPDELRAAVAEFEFEALMHMNASIA